MYFILKIFLVWLILLTQMSTSLIQYPKNTLTILVLLTYWRIEFFSGVYDVAFAKQKIKNKNKTLNSFWITKGLQSSSKRKQKLYKKFLKKINKISEKRYKTYKTLFKTLRKKSKRSHYSNLTDKYKCNIKKTWVVIKEIIGKSKFKIKKLPHRIVFDEKEIIDDKTLRNN